MKSFIEWGDLSLGTKLKSLNFSLLSYWRGYGIATLNFDFELQEYGDFPHSFSVWLLICFIHYHCRV